MRHHKLVREELEQLRKNQRTLSQREIDELERVKLRYKRLFTPMFERDRQLCQELRDLDQVGQGEPYGSDAGE